MKLKTALVIWSAISVCALAQSNLVPDAARPFLSKIKELSPVLGAGARGPEPRSEFDASMLRITELVDRRVADQCKAREANDIDNKIVAIAFDRRDNPNTYKAIDEHYLNAPPPSKVMAGRPRYPGLLTEHATEQFRLAWEYYLLCPLPEPRDGHQFIDFQLDLVLRALKQINSPRSQSLYEYVFVSSLQKAGILAGGVEWKALFAAMSLEPSSEALNRLIRCVEKTSNLEKVYPDVQHVLFTTLLGIGVRSSEKFRQGTFSPTAEMKASALERRDAWRSAIEDVLQQNLSPETRSILQRALSHPPL